MKDFLKEARRILALDVKWRANEIGGYGPGGEVIYNDHPAGCPSVLVDACGGATATFMSNGSAGFDVRQSDGTEVRVLDGHFDAVEKHEHGVPSSNVWAGFAVGARMRYASLINPLASGNCRPNAVKIVKTGDPVRSMWYCSELAFSPGIRIRTAVRFSLRISKLGPVLMRETFVENAGGERAKGSVWTFFHAPGTQQFVYNKRIWYDMGLPLSPLEIVVSASVPYSEVVQIKRIFSVCRNAAPVEATCDYSSFVGHSGASAFSPEAVARGRLIGRGAGSRLNRFSVPTVAVSRFSINLAPGRCAGICQGLLYVTEPGTLKRFRAGARCSDPEYPGIERAFRRAARRLASLLPARSMIEQSRGARKRQFAPRFELSLPAQPVVAHYANSAWMGVRELYEHCRAHGARLADGIELGTRDRAQDMWPMMKQDPERVRQDLAHAFGFMYVTTDAFPRSRRRLILREKLHGMFPRQYPSRWNDRSVEVRNDNRPYADSPLWLVDALNMYIRETGDFSILLEEVGTVRLTDPDHPETSGMEGCGKRLSIAEVVSEIFKSYRRHVSDSPYGLAQVLYGDWCDPVDMFGTGAVGDSGTRGRGRGAQVRLSAHLFLAIVGTIDILASRPAAKALGRAGVGLNVAWLAEFANLLRRNVVKVAFEHMLRSGESGFVSFIHEFRKDGTRPDYRRGETGYTLGSMRGRDFDGIKRRDLTAQAFCLEMLNTRRPCLEDLPGSDRLIRLVLDCVDLLFFNEKLGLTLFTRPVANSALAVSLVGRMGVLPSGCAENGEYHHAQAFMHRFRLSIPGQADAVWRQFKPMMSAQRDTSLAGPFETPCTSYCSDREDPHFGKGMYFGLSGSVDWLVEIFQKIAGLELALHDPDRPAVKVAPNLPRELDHSLTFKRVIHLRGRDGTFREIPFTLTVVKEGTGSRVIERRIRVNGKPAESAEVRNIGIMRAVRIEISCRCSG